MSKVSELIATWVTAHTPAEAQAAAEALAARGIAVGAGRLAPPLLELSGDPESGCYSPIDPSSALIAAGRTVHVFPPFRFNDWAPGGRCCCAATPLDPLNPEPEEDA